MPVRNRFAEMLPEITEWRHDLHAHPELLYDTHRTAGMVAEKLRAFGCDEVVEGLGGPSVVGLIHGAGGPGRMIGLRADMDALPIAEATGAAYASTSPGKMHACGHDGHTAMLLGAAKYLAETRHFTGTVAVIFQPAEEGGAGADAMMKDGLFERFPMTEVWGMHNWPGQAVGSFAIRPGAFFAATDEFIIDITGDGGHAAKPNENIDPIIAASQIVLALQTVVSRNADPVGQLVVSVTNVHAGSGAHNVTPSTAQLHGTVRTLDPDLRTLAETRMRQIAEATAQAFGARAEVTYNRGYPVMVNSEVETGIAAEIARGVSGDCADADLVMGGEDFAFMLEAMPGAYILIGNGDTAPIHHPEYDFSDEVIPAGCSYWADLVESRLAVA